MNMCLVCRGVCGFVRNKILRGNGSMLSTPTLTTFVL